MVWSDKVEFSSLLKSYLENILDKNGIYATVQVFQTGTLRYNVNILLDYEEYLKVVILSETEITDKINIGIDFTIRDV